MPFFTVVIPTHNRAELLKEAIQSVLEQTFKDFELIVVDDHSSDNTKDVVASFGNDHNIIYMMNDRTKGGAGARNTGIFEAKGEWIAFLDDDDVWLPKKLELQYNKIQELDDSVGLIYTGYASYDFDNKHEILHNIPQKEGWIQKDLLYNNYIKAFGGVVIRSDLLRMVGGLDERFPAYQDNELYVRISQLAKVAFIKDILLYVRTANKDRISIDPHKKLLAYQLFWDKYRNLINNNPRLRHRIASRVLVYAFIKKDSVNMVKALPWTFAGLLFDPTNFFWTMRMILSSLIRNKYSGY